MTPEEFAARHPRLYHLARTASLPSIERHGLLSAEAICDRLGLAPDERAAIVRARRPEAVTIERQGERFTISDNKPLIMGPLERCLRDGLTPADWLMEINRRVFFWVDEASAANLARAYPNEPRTLLAFDTYSLAKAHGDTMCLSPINGGNTRRRPAPRGANTYAPITRYGYDEWRALRRSGGEKKGLDLPKEVTVDYAVPDAMAHTVA